MSDLVREAEAHCDKPVRAEADRNWGKAEWAKHARDSERVIRRLIERLEEIGEPEVEWGLCSECGEEL